MLPKIFCGIYFLWVFACVSSFLWAEDPALYSPLIAKGIVFGIGGIFYVKRSNQKTAKQ